MSGNYFKGKNILITGITGFVGSHLAERLSNLGAHVYGTSRSQKAKNIFKVDILDFVALEKLVESQRITLCFHLAAEASVESGQNDPYDTFRTNVLGTLNILELARRHAFKKIIITSTSHVYGLNTLPYLEKYTPKPSRPYETSKTCTDIIAQSYADTFDLPVLIPRFVNIYGPGDRNFNRLIPKTIKSILLNEVPTMWGGDAVRDYLYIDDAIDAYLTLAQHTVPEGKSNRVFNFGGKNRISVEDLILKIIKISGKKMIVKKVSAERVDEISKQYVSWRKSQKVLKWEPQIGLRDGLKKTIEWYDRYLTKTMRI